MLITLTTAGSRGDVQPAVALGAGLKQAGYAVRVVAFEDFRTLVTEYGLEFYPTQVSMDQLMSDFGGSGQTESGAIGVRFVPYLLSMLRKAYTQLTVDFWKASQGAAAVVGNPAASYLSQAVASKQGIPYIETTVFPPGPTRAYPSVLWPRSSLPGSGKGLRGAFNLLTYNLIGMPVWLVLRPMVNRCRKEVLDLPPVQYPTISAQIGALPIPTLAGYSTHALPRPGDYGAHIHITGYWFVNTPGYTPPDDLKNFLASGPPPVYIGFGSMPSQDPEQMAALVSQALRLAGQRGLLYAGHGGRGLRLSEGSDNLLLLGSTPHDWLFQRTAAVVHHGGAGTTAAGLRFGVPSVLVPMLGDQHLWGQCVAGLGVGPEPIPRSKLTAERLGEAIAQAVSDSLMRQKATELGIKIRAEDGVGNAVRHIQAVVGS